MKSGRSATHVQETKCSQYGSHSILGLNYEKRGTLQDVLKPKHSAPTWGLPETGLSRGLNPGAGAMSTLRDGNPSPEEPLDWATGPKEAVDSVRDYGGVSFRNIKVFFFCFVF